MTVKLNYATVLEQRPVVQDAVTVLTTEDVMVLQQGI